MPRLLPLLYLLIVMWGCSKKDSVVGPSALPGKETPATSAYFNPDQAVIFNNPILDKNFYLAGLMLNEKTSLHNFISNPELQNLKDSLLQRMEQATQSYTNNLTALIKACRFTAKEQIRIQELWGIAVEQGDIPPHILNSLRASGCYVRYENVIDTRFIQLIWTEVLQGIEHTLDVYGTGKAPRDPDSDSVSFSLHDPVYINHIRDYIQSMEQNTPAAESFFFEPLLNLSLQLLQLNERDEAGRFELLSEGENAKALHHMASVNWKAFPYSVILILGDSPNSPGDAINLSQSAKKRLAIGFDRYQMGKAPFILISGANVYPYKTPYHEAVEMKKHLLKSYDISADRILIDPHGRHTTTNFRNTSRLLYRYGIPDTLKVLAVATESHMDYVMSPGFYTRCLNDLGYFPMHELNRIGKTDVEFYPQILSLHIDPMDPLDP